MKILLIDPPFKRFTGFVNFYFPIGLAYVASMLRGDGDDVVIYDVDAVKKGSDIDFCDEYKRLELYRKGLNDDNHEVWKEIEDVLADVKPDLVGITCMTTKFGSALKVARIVKKTDPAVPVIAGGPHPTLLPDQTLRCKDIDIAVKGEGERTILELVRLLKNGNDLRDVEGISFRNNGQICHNPPRPYMSNLDEIPFPSRDLLMSRKSYTSEDMGVIMTSRGCPFNCSYCCHMWQKKVRNRSVDNVIAEIKQVKATYGTRQFEFKDDSFSLNKDRTFQLCSRIIDEKLKINWGCSTRVNLLDEDVIRAMKRAGCNIVKLGIETGSEKILTETKKGVTFEQIRTAADLLNKHRLMWSGYFMVGLPTETEQDIMKTYEFMKELNPYYAGLGVYNPFPKTDLFDQAVRMGLLHCDVDLDHFFNTNPKDYFFADRNKRVAGITKERFDELASYMMDGFNRHNTRLGNIVRRGWARRRVYVNDLKLLRGDVKKAFRWYCSGRKRMHV